MDFQIYRRPWRRMWSGLRLQPLLLQDWRHFSMGKMGENGKPMTWSIGIPEIPENTMSGINDWSMDSGKNRSYCQSIFPSLIILDHSTGDENAHPVPRSEAAEKALEAAGIWQYLGPSGGRELELELWLYPYETGCQVRTELLEDLRFDTQFFRNKNLQRVFFLQANPSPGRGWTLGMAFSSQPSWIGASGTTRPAGAAARTSIVNACGCTTSRPRSW